MPRPHLPALAVLIAACRDRPPTGSAALAASSGTTVFDILDAQIYLVPDDVPDALLDVPSPYHAGAAVSLREGLVTSAWVTVPAPDGTPPVVVYRCTPDGAGGRHWVGAPSAQLAPLGVDLTAFPDLLPFTALSTLALSAAWLAPGAAGPSFTLDSPSRAAEGAPLVPSRSVFTGVEEDVFPGDTPDDLPIARIRKTQSARFGPFLTSSLERADDVLRVHTHGGAGPGPGTNCAAGDGEQQVPFTAELWFVRLPSAGADTGGTGGSGGAGGGS